MLPQASLQLPDAVLERGVVCTQPSVLRPQALHFGLQAAELLAQVSQHAVGFLQRLRLEHAHSVCQTQGSRQLLRSPSGA